MRYHILTGIKNLPLLPSIGSNKERGTISFRTPFYNSLLRIPLDSGESIWYLLPDNDLTSEQRENTLKKLNSRGVESIMNGTYLDTTVFSMYLNIDLIERKINTVDVSPSIGYSPELMDDMLKMVNIHHNSDNIERDTFVIVKNPQFLSDFKDFVAHYSYRVYEPLDFFKLRRLIRHSYDIVNNYFLYDPEKSEFVYYTAHVDDRLVDEVREWTEMDKASNRIEEIDKFNAEVEEKNKKKKEKKQPRFVPVKYNR